MSASRLPDGYGELQRVQERGRDILYLGRRESDGRAVALKVLVPSGRPLRDEARAHHELAVLSRLAGRPFRECALP